MESKKHYFKRTLPFPMIVRYVAERGRNHFIADIWYASCKEWVEGVLLNKNCDWQEVKEPVL